MNTVSNVNNLDLNTSEQERTINDFLSQGLDLFSGVLDPAHTKILSDNSYEIVKVNTDKYALDGRSNIFKLIQTPTKNPLEIQARKHVLDKVNSLSPKLLNILYSARSDILSLNFFDSKFEDIHDIGRYIKEVEEYGVNRYNAPILLDIQISGPANNQLENARKRIPQFIQALRNLGMDFFYTAANQLEQSYKEARKFSLEDLKVIYENEDVEAFANLREHIRSFANIYNVVDSILVTAQWIKEGYLNSVSGIDYIQQEVSNNIGDPRHLLTGDLNDFYNHVLIMLLKILKLKYIHDEMGVVKVLG